MPFITDALHHVQSVHLNFDLVTDYKTCAAYRDAWYLLTNVIYLLRLFARLQLFKDIILKRSSFISLFHIHDII